MADETPALDKTDAEVIAEKSARITELENQVKVKDQVIAALNEALGKTRTIIVSQAQENFQRINEILEVAEMRIQKANAPPAEKKA